MKHPLAAVTVPVTVAVTFALATAAVLVPATPAHADQTYRFRAAVRQLNVAPQTHEASYDRDAKFGDWVSQGVGCDTRAVVLQQESKVPVTQTDDCIVETGRWRSYYDAATYTDADDLQIDHVVAVKNAWITGAWAWTQQTREDYYNDLDDPRTLVAVDAGTNASKSDLTPDEWLPPAHHCRYVREYTFIKLRWRLTVTRPEKRAIRTTASRCRNVRITYTPATIELASR